MRRTSTFNTGRIDHLYQDPHTRNVRLFLHYGDLADSGQLSNIIGIFARTRSTTSAPRATSGFPLIFPSIRGRSRAWGRSACWRPSAAAGCGRYYQASSSEMFGAASPPNRRPPPSGREAPMPPPRSMPIG